VDSYIPYYWHNTEPTTAYLVEEALFRVQDDGLDDNCRVSSVFDLYDLGLNLGIGPGLDLLRDLANDASSPVRAAARLVLSTALWESRSSERVWRYGWPKQ